VCRSIKTLRHADEVATDEEIRAAARQFVRKVSGFSKPTAKHEAAFEGAVDEITDGIDTREVGLHLFVDGWRLRNDCVRPRRVAHACVRANGAIRENKSDA